MKKLQRFSAFLLAAVVLLSASATAHAHDVPEDREDCSITVTVKYGGKAVSGGKLTCVRVGEVLEDDGNYYFSRLYEPKVLKEIDIETAATELELFYLARKDTYPFQTETKTVSILGTAKFENLPTGLYLIRQTEAARGYSKLSAFLVSVPYMEDGKYQYKVDAKVKSELEQEPKPTVTTTPTKPGKPTLPQTGQLNWPVPALAAAGTLLAVGGYLTSHQKKRGRK